MKNIIAFFLLILFSNFLFGQFNVSIGMGPIVNFGKWDESYLDKNKVNFSYFAKSQISYTKSFIKSNLDFHWSFAGWQQKEDASFGDIQLKMRIYYFTLNPSIEIKPIKQIGLHFGVYGATNLEETFFNSNQNKWVQFPSINRQTNRIDYGFTGGLSFYSSRNFSISIKYFQGIKNITSFKTIDITNRFLDDIYLKNRSIQLSSSYIFD